MLYIILACALLLASYQYDYIETKSSKKQIYLLFLFILIFIAGFRYNLGIDSIRYENVYRYQVPLHKLSQDAIDDSRYGIGWMLLQSCARTISSDFSILQLIQSLYVNLIIGYFIYKYSKHPFLALFLYFIFLYPEFMFEILREACAVATYITGWIFFKKKKWIKYYICCSIAVCFHISAIITFLVPIAYAPGMRSIFKVNLRLCWILGLVLIVGLYLSVKLFDFFAALSLLESVQERAATYANIDHQSGVRGASILGFISMGLNRVIYPAIAYIFYIKNRTIDIKESHPLEIMIVFYMIFSIASFSIMILQRFTNYFAPFVILLLSNASYLRLHIAKKNID